MYLIKNAEVYQNSGFVKKDILLSQPALLAIEDTIDPVGMPWIKVLDFRGKKIVPGFIDGHVHIAGGGGEGGFKTRTPELKMTDMVKAGVTCVVGCLGTDGTSRSMEGLVAKMYALKEEGVSAYCYTGSYRLPLSTLTGDIMKDIMMVEGIVGIGEVAISDHRSAHAGIDCFCRAVSDARVAGKLSGKAGICNIHLGDGKGGLGPINEVLASTDLPITQFLPTHMNRNPQLFEQGIAYAKNGGYLDFTTSTTPAFIEAGEVPAAQALAQALTEGVSIDQITFTSDAQGSLPQFDEEGNLKGLTLGKLDSLYQAVLDAHQVYGVDFEVAIKTITQTPADVLMLKNKGQIKEKWDADLVVLNEDYSIESVFCRGQLMMHGGGLLVKDVFSDDL